MWPISPSNWAYAIEKNNKPPLHSQQAFSAIDVDHVLFATPSACFPSSLLRPLNAFLISVNLNQEYESTFNK